jgi:hypothetical protein
VSALLKTLVGDLWNVSVVAVIVLAEVVLVSVGAVGVAALLIPVLTLAGVAWLARH